MSVQSTFESSFLALLSGRVNDTAFSFAWGRAPQGAPASGSKEVVLYYAPGGDRQLTHSGVSTEQSRRIQVSIFSVEVQDAKDAAKAVHQLDGYGGTLSDGTFVFAVVPAMQDIDNYLEDERIFQVVFEWDVHLCPSSSGS